MFGSAPAPQNESTRFHPRSAYGIRKWRAIHLTRNYREAYHLHASSGIFTTMSRRAAAFEFVTRKITSGVARILAGASSEMRLGNLEARRDWGHAREYVEAMWLMLQQPTPDDYVIATGETHSVREFLECAFGLLGLDPYQYLVLDERFIRPAEVDLLLGDTSKARARLGWSAKIKFSELVREMVYSDLDLYSHAETQAAVQRTA